jgi:hypothetical protein
MRTPKSAFRECECHPHTLPKVGLRHPPWPPTYLSTTHFQYYTFTHMYKIYLWIYIFHIVYVGKGDWTLVSLAPHQCFGHQTTPSLCKTIWYQMHFTYFLELPWIFLLMCITTFEFQFFFINKLVNNLIR